MGLGLSLLSLSLIDLVRPNKVNGFGFPLFRVPELSYSVDEASDTSDLEGKIVAVLELDWSL